MMKLKTGAMGLAFIGIGAAGVILAAPQEGRIPAALPVERSQPSATKEPASRALPKEVTQARERPDGLAMKDYVIEPPDIILVEVLEALPGRPISGERLVRPDGRISLGFYGEVYVAGLTLGEAKEKIVLKLREYLSDRLLGLTKDDDTVNVEGPVPPGRRRLTDRVFVDVSKMNSKAYSVEGAVREPGRFPFTGQETVLDALNFAGGLSQRAAYDHVVLYRSGPPGTKVALQALPVNVDQVVMGSDPTTNYQLMPNDRLVIPFRSRDGAVAVHDVESTRAPSLDDRDELPAMTRRGMTGRGRAVPDSAPRRVGASAEGPGLREIERRLDVLERKIDRVLDALEERGR